MYEITNFAFQLFIGELFAILCAWIFPKGRQKLLVFFLLSGVVITGIFLITKPFSTTVTQKSIAAIEDVRTPIDYLNNYTEINISTPIAADERTSTINTHDNVSAPRVLNFISCKGPCNGYNATKVFPGGTTIVYLEWDYENIPFGSDYERVWTMDGEGWVRYTCKWPGKEKGHEKVSLTEPDRLHSGVWEMTILINEEIIFRENIIIEGKIDIWNPVGTLNQCYGKVDR